MKLVGFGDSWMWGDELVDPAIPHAHPVLVENTPYREKNCFLGQLGTHYDVPTENFGWPGGSLQSAIWTYLWWLENGTDHEDSVVIITLTESGRTSWYNPRHRVYDNDPPWNRFMHSSWLHHGAASEFDREGKNDWEQLGKLYTVLSDSLPISKLNYQQAVHFFQGQAHRHPVVMLNVSDPPCIIDVPGLVNNSQSIHHWVKRQGKQLEQPTTNPGGHPNEFGHSLIRDLLIKKLDPVIINNA